MLPPMTRIRLLEPRPCSPLLAGLLSLLLPGLGQIYIGQKKKGAVLLAVSLLTCFWMGLANLVAAADAWSLARKLSSGEPIRPWQPGTGLHLAWRVAEAVIRKQRGS